MALLSLTSANAQIGPSPDATNTPNYGIYGSAPKAESTPFTCGEPAFATINLYPDTTQGDGIPPWSQTVPLNGYKNFNFYYNDSGTGFLSGGGYIVTYTNASGTNCYGSGDIVSYSPNGNHTNGTQVRPFYLGTTGYEMTIPRGVHGLVLVKIPGGGGTTTALANATATLTLGVLTWREKTNGIGYVDVYYSSRLPGTFLPYAEQPYDLSISGVKTFGSLTCTFTYSSPIGPYVIWRPDGSYVNLGAEFDFGTLTLSGTGSCAP